MDIQIGTVTHYYDKIGVAVIDIANQPLKVGDTIKVSGHDKEFTQAVESLQIEHKQVKEAGVGESCGLKLEQPAKPGDLLYLVSK